MCYIVCRTSFDSVDSLPNVPPPSMSAQSKKEKRRFRKSLKAVVDKIMCRGKPKAECTCLSVVEVEEKPAEKDSGDFVRIDVDVDVITDAPSLLNTSFGEEQPVLVQTSAPELPGLNLGLSSPDLVPDASSIVARIKHEPPSTQLLPSPVNTPCLGASPASASGDASVPPPVAPKHARTSHRRALGSGARDEVTLARRGRSRDRVSNKTTRDRTTERKEHSTTRVPLAEVTNYGTATDSKVDSVIRAPIVTNSTVVLARSLAADMVKPDASTPRMPVSKDCTPAPEAIPAPSADCQRIDEESALSQPATGVICLQNKASLQTPHTPVPLVDTQRDLVEGEASVACSQPTSPVEQFLALRVDVTPVSGASIGISGTPDIFSPGTPGTLVDSSFAPTETSPPVRPHFKKAAVESPEASHTFVQEGSIKAAAVSVSASPDPKVFLEIPAADLPVGLLDSAACPGDVVPQEKVYADACVETRPPCDTTNARSSPSCVPALPHSHVLRAIVGNILSFAASGTPAQDPAPSPKASRISAGPTIPLDDRGSPRMTRAACDDLRALIQAERRAADTRRAILDTMARLLAKHEPADVAATTGETEEGIIGYEAFVQRSLAAEEEWERDMGGVVSALMQLACVPRAASSPRVLLSPNPAPQPPLSVPEREVVDEEDPFKKMCRDLAGAAAKKALLFEGQRTLRAVEERERWRAENAQLETVKLRETGLLGKEKDKGKKGEDEETVNAKKLRYQQYVARKAYEKRIGQMKDQPVPVVKNEGGLVVGVPAAGLVVPGTPQKGKLSPPASPSRLPVPPIAVDATSGGVSVSPLRATLDRLKATVSAMAAHQSSRTPGRKTTHAPSKSSTKPPVTPVASRAPSSSRLYPSTPKSVNPRTPSSVRVPSTQSRMTTPRSSRPTTPCPNRGAHKLSTPERKPPVPRVTSRKAVGASPNASSANLAVPRGSPSVPGTPRRGGQGAALATTPKTAPIRCNTAAKENVPRSPRGATKDADSLPKTVSGRQLQRTPLRTKQMQNKPPAKPVFRF